MFLSAMKTDLNLISPMTTYVMHALALNAPHYATQMKEVERLEDKLKLYQKRNQKFASLGTMLLDLNGHRVAQVEYSDLSVSGIWQTEEIQTTVNHMSTALGKPRNCVSDIFDWEVSCVTPNPIGVEVN